MVKCCGHCHKWNCTLRIEHCRPEQSHATSNQRCSPTRPVELNWTSAENRCSVVSRSCPYFWNVIVNSDKLGICICGCWKDRRPRDTTAAGLLTKHAKPTDSPRQFSQKTCEHGRTCHSFAFTKSKRNFSTACSREPKRISED